MTGAIPKTENVLSEERAATSMSSFLIPTGHGAGEPHSWPGMECCRDGRFDPIAVQTADGLAVATRIEPDTAATGTIVCPFDCNHLAPSETSFTTLQRVSGTSFGRPTSTVATCIGNRSATFVVQRLMTPSA